MMLENALIEHDSQSTSNLKGDLNMKRILVFAYGLICYAAFLGTFLYLAAFLGNLLPVGAMDSPATTPLWQALLIDALLVGVFGLQHSIMARQKFKEWWTRFVAEPMERSTYVMFSSLALILLFWQWRPIGRVIWDVQDPVGRAIFHGLLAFGLMIVLVATFLINHFDLFGLRQVWLYLRGKPYSSLTFTTPGPYKVIRHPMYVGWLLAFWATPTMTIAHLVFAVGMTIYILIAIRFEERDLVEYHGEPYVVYRRTVPMLIPLPRGGDGKRRREAATPAPATGSAS
jgi:protein-S-isoprenylcysteine O-methyltransferase Ste14